MLEWLTFFSTVLLVAVTAWYAVLTRSLARSARDSAKSAQVAAEHAAQSVAAAVAAVEVQFSALTGVNLNVLLACDGATVFVHKVRVVEAWHMTSRNRDGDSYVSVIDEDGLELTADVSLPVRMHKGETLFLKPPSDHLVVSQDFSVASLIVRVSYSLDGSGEGVEREVLWEGVPDQDFWIGEPGSKA